MALPRVVLLPGLARYSSALQADCYWHCLGADDLVQLCAQLAYPDTAAICSDCLYSLYGRWFVVIRAECQISRFPLLGAIFAIVWSVYLTSGF